MYGKTCNPILHCNARKSTNKPASLKGLLDSLRLSKRVLRKLTIHQAGEGQVEQRSLQH